LGRGFVVWRRGWPIRAARHPYVLPLIVCSITLGAVFLVDVMTPPDVVLASLYMVPAFLAGVSLPSRLALIICVAAVAMQITALSLQRESALTDLAEAGSVTFVFSGLRLVHRPRPAGREARPEEAKGNDGWGYVIRTPGEEILTPRERQVADLAVEGRSTKEIARQLSIGRRTVETHLAHTYAKMGVGSKVELIIEYRGRSRSGPTKRTDTSTGS
jgi:DNA-binding CsgD family transcriptional regulator